MPIKTVVDRRKDIALVFLLFSIGGIWWSVRTNGVIDTGVSWSTLVLAIVLIGISAGLWIAREWARWAAGVAGILFSIRHLLMLAGAYMDNRTPPPVMSVAIIMVMFFALFWGAIAFYCLRPSTGKLFAQIREARARAVAG